MLVVSVLVLCFYTPASCIIMLTLRSWCVIAVVVLSNKFDVVALHKLCMSLPITLHSVIEKLASGM